MLSPVSAEINGISSREPEKKKEERKKKKHPPSSINRGG
jgi:hypothetical protein